MCNCEDGEHFGGVAHKYLAVKAGARRAMYVGAICDDCAATCMNEFILED